MTSSFNYFWMISLTIFSNHSHTKSSDFSQYIFFIYFLSLQCTITYLNIRSSLSDYLSIFLLLFTHHQLFACPLSQMLT